MLDQQQSLEQDEENSNQSSYKLVRKSKQPSEKKKERAEYLNRNFPREDIQMDNKPVK